MHIREFLGLNNQDPAVHNLLLALYSKETDDVAFIRFLEREGDVFYDLKYALRLCVERGKKRPCVLMYVSDDDLHATHTLMKHTHI